MFSCSERILSPRPKSMIFNFVKGFPEKREKIKVLFFRETK
jgi:hypothetical protein